MAWYTVANRLQEDDSVLCAATALPTFQIDEKKRRKKNVHEKKANERKKCARQAKHFGITNTEQKFSENARLLFLMLRLLSLVFEGNKDCFHDAE